MTAWSEIISGGKQQISCAQVFDRDFAFLLSRYSVVDAKSKRMAKLFELGGISFDENESLSGPMTRWSDDEEGGG